jgi:magnesium-transporting ATPase (P-type)
MITGDHIHTAIAVAQDCGIVQKKEFEPPVRADEQKDESDDDDIFKIPTPRDGTSSIKSVSVGGGSSKEGRGSSLANFFSRRTAKSLTMSQRSEGMELKIYIVDENGISGRVQITDAVTDDIIRISLEDLLEKVSNNASSSPSTSAGDGEYIELAVTGAGIECVRRDYPEGILRTLVRHAAVFARTKPADKKFVVEELMMTPEFADLRVVRSVDLREGNSDLEAMKKSHYDAEAGIYLTDESAQPLLTASPNKTNRGVRSGQSEEVNFDDKDLTSEKCYHVLFCGDGANDMTALRAATVRYCNSYIFASRLVLLYAGSL